MMNFQINSSAYNSFTSPVVAYIWLSARWAYVGVSYGAWWALRGWWCVPINGIDNCSGNPMPLLKGCYCPEYSNDIPLAYDRASSKCIPASSCADGRFSFY